MRLNKLINDYRVENERCTMKISQLKQRLHEQQEEHGTAGGTSGNHSLRGSAANDKIYAKSYKVTNDKLGGGRRSGGAKAGGVPNYYHNSASAAKSSQHHSNRMI